MGIEVKVNTSWAKLQTDKLKAGTRQALDEAAIENRTTIQDNATRGLRFDGKPLKAGGYSKKHADLRKLAGRQVAKIDLSLTGHMMRSLKHKVKKHRTGAIAEMFFLNTKAPSFEIKNGKAVRTGKQQSALHKARENQQMFKFFGWNAKVLDRLRSKLRNIYKN